MKKVWIPLFFLLLGLFMTGCGPEDTEESASSNTVNVYYLNKEATTITSVPYEVQSETQDDVLLELLGELSEMTDNIELRAPLSMGFSVLECYVEGTQLVLNVDEKYRELSLTDEILVRAALVRTMSQVEGVDCVNMLIRGEPLTDNVGNPIGVMTAETFIDNEGSEINAYETAVIRLYFANAEGTDLYESSREVVYNSNISMEKLVLENLIAGPEDTELYPTINPATKVLSVVVTDGVCYINLSNEFLTQPYNVTADVTIYSIVNTMAELSNVNKVQISVNGENALVYRELLSLDVMYERNLDMVIQAGY